MVYESDDPPDLTGGAAGPRQIQPWITALLQAEHASLLLGNGLTMAACGLAGVPPPSMSGGLALPKDLVDAIETRAATEAKRMGRGIPNIEDRLQVALTIEAGLAALGDPRAADIRSAADKELTAIVEAVLAAEDALRGASPSAPPMPPLTPIGFVAAFLMAFASRTPTRDRLQIFSTNYDRVLEYACEQVGLRIVDRFVGTLEPRFRSSRLDIDWHYNPPGIRGEPRFLEGVVRLTKLHGSVDWKQDEHSVVRGQLAFGDVSSASSIAASSLLVYPQSSKDVETSFFPYADLFRDFSAALCRPNSVLVTYGYGFGDDHINRVIGDMLTIPSTHLLAISFDDASGRLAAFVESAQAHRQISILQGPVFGDLATLVTSYLPSTALSELEARIIPKATTTP